MFNRKFKKAMNVLDHEIEFASIKYEECSKYLETIKDESAKDRTRIEAITWLNKKSALEDLKYKISCL